MVEALAENRRILDTLMHNLPGMVYRCRNDPDWTMEFVSDGCMDLIGYAPEDLIQNRTIFFASLIVAEDRPRVNDMVQHEITRFQPFQLEYWITDRSGRVRWVWEQGRGLFNNQGELVALEGYITDSSDRKRTEEALRQANKKLHLLPGITRHDINNQLTMLMGFLDLAKEAAGNHEPVCRYIGKGRKISDTIQP